MKKIVLTFASLAISLGVMAQDYDLNKPFGFCTVSSRTANTAYDITGGGCYTYPVPEELSEKTIVLKSNGQDMKGIIQNAIKQKDIIILDGSDGDFIVSSSIGFERGNKTILGINNARICTQWYLTDEDKTLLDNATAKDKNGETVTGVKNMSTNSSDDLGGTVNGSSIKEQAEYMTRKTLYEKYGNENYRNAGIFSLNKENVIIRNITFVGPGAVDVGGSDLISATGAKHCWIDHCTFMDGEDGNFDIAQQADFFTVSWCIFRYTNRSYMHQNTNLIGSNDSETTGYLNTTFAFNWWGEGCKQRMPMARVGKIHMLNNYYSCAGSNNCINPRKNSEFLIEGNYFTSGVTNFYSQSDATAVTWGQQNYHASKTLPSSMGSTVTVPYEYTVAPYNVIPTEVQFNAGATLPYGDDTPSTGTKGSINWSMSGNTNAEVASTISDYISSSNFQVGSNLSASSYGTYSSTRFCKIQAEEPLTSAEESNKVVFSFTTKSGYKFQATSISLNACRCGTGNGNFDAYWQDAGNTVTLAIGEGPNKNESTIYSYNVAASSTATEGTCSLILYLYNIKYVESEGGTKTYKQMGLANVSISGNIINTTTGVSIPVTLSPVMSTEYFNIAGQRVSSNTKGLIIEKQRLENGQVVTRKVMK